MPEEKNIKHAKSVFETLCKALDNDDWNYDKDEHNLTIECGVRGDDLPMKLGVKVDADRMLVLLLSQLPFDIQDGKRVDAAVAVSAVNNSIVDGCFDYDVISGRMFFRMTNSFIESTISEDVFIYMLSCSAITIDEYNDKFLMLSKGVISLEQFIASLSN